MNYAQIRKMDVSNGEGLGIALFVSGCHFHCKNCFNSQTWDFEFGNKWDEETEKHFLELLNNKHIKRVSFLGGEPLCDENIITVEDIIYKVSKKRPDVKIWLYTGYRIDNIKTVIGDMAVPSFLPKSKLATFDILRSCLTSCIDYIVDGQYVDELKDLSLKFRGSSNQRVIDIKKSLEQNEIVLHC